MSDIHALIREFLQQQTVMDLAEKPPQPPDRYNKAGVVPFVRDEDGFRFHIMKPRSTAPELGIPPFQVCKGTRMHQVPGAGWCDMREGMNVADKETLIETALREGIEELGLKLENIDRLYDMGAFGFSSATTGKAKQMWLFAASVKDEDDFLHEREVAITTEARQWMSAQEFAVAGREDHRYILRDMETALAAYFKEQAYSSPERNPQFVNKLANASSPYLKQHAHNPVNWYPWGEEAIELARVQNKPILLSIGYSTCYWCHVMEREVFENPSIATLMNGNFMNIKVDREEYPDLDEIYMVARQALTHEGGWPNNVFLTPDLKPFFAGGTFPAADTYGKASFPRVLEWLHYSWQTQENDVRKTADDVMNAVQHFLVFSPPAEVEKKNIETLAGRLLIEMKKHHDTQSGGFFQAPKFPHEHYLKFLLKHYERTEDKQALDIALLSLRKMAAGGIYDHVGCGFHRYAVDKEWYVPHFEKMLYNQAMLARLYTDAARISGNPWLADIAKSILEFVRGPLTDAGGAFYSAIDAETDGVEGEYYAWTPGELQQLLSPEENKFLTTFYALADIPQFPGHKHTQGQALIARKPLDEAALEQGIPYVQLAAMNGQLMNKLLTTRNVRKPPRLDNKIIVAWNGLMIDAFAHAGKFFEKPDYIKTARKAADFLLEHLINDQGELCRIFADGRAQISATLEDYAFLIKGLLALHAAAPDAALLEAAVSLAGRVDKNFSDTAHAGYFFTEPSKYLPLRIKNPDDSTLPNANAIMMENLHALHAITGEKAYRTRAEAMRDFFFGQERLLLEVTGMVTAAMNFEPGISSMTSPAPREESTENNVRVTAVLNKNGELVVTLDITGGWHINANKVNNPSLIPTQVSVQGEGVEVLETIYPEPQKREEGLLVYEGVIRITARLTLGKEPPPLKVMVRFQPCRAGACLPVKDLSLTV